MGTNKGFGIFEVMISSLVLAIVMTALYRNIRNYRLASVHSEFEGKLEDVRIFFRNQFDCETTLRNNGCGCNGEMFAYNANNEKILDSGVTHGAVTCNQVGDYFVFKPVVTFSDRRGSVLADPYNGRMFDKVDLFNGVPTVCSGSRQVPAPKYRYMPLSYGLTMAEKATACMNLGAGWAMASLTTGDEILAMRTYLSTSATPARGNSAYSLPIIENPCNTIRDFTFPDGYSPDVNCSGDKVLVNWPGVNDNCEPQATGPNCLFQDGQQEDRFPILCEYNGPEPLPITVPVCS